MPRVRVLQKHSAHGLKRQTTSQAMRGCGIKSIGSAACVGRGTDTNLEKLRKSLKRITLSNKKKYIRF